MHFEPTTLVWTSGCGGRGLAGGAAGLIWDYENWDVLTAREEKLARDVGALTVSYLSH